MVASQPPAFGNRLAHVFLGHAVPPSTTAKLERKSLTKRATTCSATQLYSYPAAGDTFAASSSAPITFEWDPSCVTASSSGNVDLTLYAPYGDKAVIRQWAGIANSDGKYEVTLIPKWWNSTTSVDMQLVIAPSGSVLPFLTVVPGPIFKVTYPAAELVTTTVGGSTVAAAAADTSTPDPITTTVTKEASDGLPAGSIFAAVFFPLAIVVGAVTLYILYTRRKQAKKRQRWSQAVDNRMSVISSHWDRTSNHTNSAAPRKSGAFSQSARRTVHSTYSGTENFAGYGAHRSDEYNQDDQQQQPEMVDVVDASDFARPRTHFGTGDRKSRGVSFAEDGSRVSRVSFGDSLHNPKLNTVYSQGHQRSKSSLSGAMGAALRQRPSIYTNQSSTSVNVLGHSAGSSSGSRGVRKESIEMVLSPEQSTGPWVLGEADVDGYRSGGDGEEKLADDDDQRRPVSQFAAVQTLGVVPVSDDPNRLSLISRASSYGSQVSNSGAAAAAAPAEVRSFSPTSPIMSPITPMTKAATVASYFPPPPTNVTSPDDAFQAYARERSGSIATPGGSVMGTPVLGQQQQQVDVRRSTVGDNNPFRSSMYDNTGAPHAQ